MADLQVVTTDSIVSLNFAIQLADGSVVDSNFDQPACSFSFGDGSLLPGFEEALLGLRIGERKAITLTPEQGFGEWQEDRLTQFPAAKFKDYELEPGLIMSFTDPSGERPGVVKTVSEDTVVIDFNHPLAGKELVFDALIHTIDRKSS